MSRVYVLATFLAIVVPVAAAPKPKDPPPPPTALEGRWAIERLAYEETVTPEEDASMVVIFTRTTMGVEKGGRPLWSQTMKARGSDTHGEFDLQTADGAWRNGLWKLENDILTICEAAPGRDRPTDFTSPAGSKRYVWVLKRLPK
jgi:uncharacterized protein (TIGR03067 family)